ncbi:MAG: hypothetical protein IOC86_13655 [Aestuariivirga sp.]|nr:hypothetical protein [Aestuariivirga sp.]
MRRPRDNSDALAAFLAKKAEIDTALARLTALSADHFNANPDTLPWGHVGDLEFYASLLKRVTDSAFREGEHTE